MIPIYYQIHLFKNYSEAERLNIAKQILGSDVYSKIFEGENINSSYTKIESDFLELDLNYTNW